MIRNAIVGAGHADLPAPPTGFGRDVTWVETKGAMLPYRQLRVSRQDRVE